MHSQHLFANLNNPYLFRYSIGNVSGVASNAVSDTGTSLIVGPPEDLEIIAKALNGSFDEKQHMVR